MTIAWVIGRTGLLGSALCAALERSNDEQYVPRLRFAWDDGDELARQLTACVAEFAGQVDGKKHWVVYWAAGVGIMSSPAEALRPETQALALLLQLLAVEQRIAACSGTIAFASSAGAIYAGCRDDVVTERSVPAPTTFYATEKLRQEALVEAFVASNRNVSALVARISTLYGKGQTKAAKQGLLSHIARGIVRNQPVQIYVPYDTMRDYLDAEDGAALMIYAARASRGAGTVTTKIIASEAPVTIAEIVSIFRRLARRAPRIIRTANRLSRLYAPRIQFRSVVLRECSAIPAKSLPIGIGQLMARERLNFASGSGLQTRNSGAGNRS